LPARNNPCGIRTHWESFVTWTAFEKSATEKKKKKTFQKYAPLKMKDLTKFKNPCLLSSKLSERTSRWAINVFEGIPKQIKPRRKKKGQSNITTLEKKKMTDITGKPGEHPILQHQPIPTNPTKSAKLLSISSILTHNESSTRST